jgi:hypothetical protein
MSDVCNFGNKIMFVSTRFTFYNLCFQVRRLFDEQFQNWKLYIMKPNFARRRGQRWSPSIISVAKKDLMEARTMVKKIIVDILNAMKKKTELPQLLHHNGAEKRVHYESYWDAAFTLSVASGDLDMRPVKYGNTYQIRLLSRRPQNENYRWLGVQIGLSLEEALGLVKAIKKAEADIESDDLMMIEDIMNQE